MCSLPKSIPLRKLERLPFRDYIHRALYDSVCGYFSNENSPVLRHNAPIQISRLRNRTEYEKVVADTYAGSEHGWMTPVELFSPFLSRAIARRIRSVAPPSGQVHVIELGAGRGTLARDVLSFWQSDKDFLSRVTYTIIEISDALASLQRRALEPWVKRGVARVCCSNAIDWFKCLDKSSDLGDALRESHCHVVATELLDNFPHDLVREGNQGIDQANVLISEDGSRHIEWTPSLDTETREAMEAFGILNDSSKGPMLSPKQFSFRLQLQCLFEELIDSGKRDIWVPTASHRLLQALVDALPHSFLTVGDFHSFPGALSGWNAPVVQSVNRGSAVVYDNVHSAPFGKVDIMFPVDFEMLKNGHASLVRNVKDLNYGYRVISQQQLFKEISTEEERNQTSCRDGYNPVLQDFENASFLLVDSIRKNRT